MRPRPARHPRLHGMGSFDTVHGGDRCGQIKAFGKNNSGLVAGDEVQLIPAPMDDAQFQAWLDGTLPARPERDFAVQMYEGGAVVVTNGVITGWSDQAPTGLPLFDGSGYPLAEPVPADTAAASDAAATALDCPTCAAVRNGTVAEHRDELAAQRQAIRDAADGRRAERARAQFKVVKAVPRAQRRP